MTSTRPRVSAEFLRRSTCERVIAGTAKAISERGYQAASIADIVKACGTARNTFYECFGGKEEAALALVAALGVEGLGETPSIDVLLIEVAAFHHAGEAERASEYILGAEKIVRFFAEAELTPPPSSEELLGTLPPGRHGLAREFVGENQRARLLEAIAGAIADRGWLAVRIADVATRAALSRRTFYEQFGSLDALAAAMVADATATDLLDGLDPRSGLYAVAVEILAQRIAEGDPESLTDKALAAIGKLTLEPTV